MTSVTDLSVSAEKNDSKEMRRHHYHTTKKEVTNVRLRSITQSRANAVSNRVGVRALYDLPLDGSEEGMEIVQSKSQAEIIQQ